MKKLFGIMIAVFLGMTMQMQTTHAVSATPLPQQPEGSVYRFWSPEYQKHVMTMGYEEANLIYTTNAAWQYDGVVFKAYQYDPADTDTICPAVASPSTFACQTIKCRQGEPIFRFLGKNNSFFYAFGPEANDIYTRNPFWTYEGVVFCAKAADNTDAGTVKAYRYYNNSQITHVFTASDAERASINANPAWQLEGVAFSVEAPAISPKQKYVNDLIAIFSTAEAKLQIPEGDMTVEELIAKYQISKSATNEAITALGQVTVPQGAEEAHAITGEVFALVGEYVDKVLLILNNTALSDTEKDNQVSDLIDEYVPAIEDLIFEFDQALTAFANS